ncbi:MAG: glycosyltransferase [Pseudomonadales bacterium]|nr:glycosyltransferase [Pseudomonadales bacterium]MBO7004639.1 glycosyltransferase [Pseudomonadales bacterium]
MAKTCIFTIVSRNYLHYARTLMNSVEQFSPAADRVVGLCDKPEDFDFSAENFDILEMASLDIPMIDKFIFRYTILELNTAIKPYIISALFQQGYEKVIYFDPDIRIYDSLDEMLSLLDEHQMLLTPHLTGPLNDDKLPSELNILVSGSYNLGYIGLKNTPDMQQFAHWWEDKLYEDCVVDLPRGLFVDQKWMDLAPGMYTDVYINRNEGWNTAYWNLKHRQVKTADDCQSGYRVNDAPLLFFHFSGFSGEAKTLSKHQDRFTKESAGTAVQKLCADYADELDANGQASTSKISYAYGNFADGTRIPDFARYIYREDYDWKRSQDDPYEATGCANFLGYLNEPVTLNGKHIPWITRLAFKLYNARPDLQEAFPDLSGAHGKRFADWYVQSAAEQAGFDECFILPVRHELSQFGDTDQQLSFWQRTRARANRLLYRAAWRYRHLVRPFVPEKLRQQVHVRLVDRLTHTVEEPSVARGPKDASLPWGVNLIGYVNAESGIGASARSNIRNLTAAAVPLAVSDFRHGNVSRMEAKVPGSVMGEPRFNINLFHINADQTVNALNQIGHEVLRGRYNIGYWAWELPEFPDEWLPAISMLDEIWVPSEFCRQTIAAKADIPVVCIPHSIESISVADPVRSSFDLPEDKVLFLNMFDALSVPERKNPEAAIQAVDGAVVRGAEDAHLVLKVSNLDKTPAFAEQLRKRAAEHDGLTLIEGYLDSEDVYRLMSACDVFLSPHRSEGFGLGLAESMLLGKPVIATAWSGNLEFMTEENSILVRSEQVVLAEDHGPYKAGQVWAEPDEEALIEAVMLLCVDSDKRLALGNSASRSIASGFSAESIGRRIVARLDVITETEQSLARAG